MIHNEGQTFAPEVRFVSDGVSFGIAIGIWAIIITVVGTAVGVLLAERTAWWLALYAIVALAGLVLLIRWGRLRRSAIGAIKRVIVDS